jgi:hypothetical protein
MMKVLKVSLLFSVALLLLASCTTFKATGLSVTNEAPKYTVLGDFNVTVGVTELLGSPAGAKLLNITAEATDSVVTAAIQKEIKAKGGTAAVNVSIIHKASFINYLLSGLTLSIYSPSQVVITGTVVK